MAMTKAIILDANRIGRNMRKEVKEAIYKRRIRILIFKGGKLERELKGRRERGSTCFREYAKNGFFHNVCERSVTKKNNHLIQEGLIRSDDQHIIALALVSAANTLHTEDNTLIEDFLNCDDIDTRNSCIKSRQNPKRKVIKATSPNSAEVKRLLNSAKASFDCCECMINGGGC